MNTTTNTNSTAVINASTTNEEYSAILGWLSLRGADLVTDNEGKVLELTWDERWTLREQVVHARQADNTVPIKVGTHNGEAHADEALALAMLYLWFPSIEIVRTRDAAKLAECDLRVDVGEGLLDHHGRRHIPGVSAATRVWQLLNNYSEGVEPLLDVVRRTACLDTGIDVQDKPFPWFKTMWKAGIRRGVDPDELFFSLVCKIHDEIVDILANARAEAEAKEAAEASIEAAGADARVITFDAASREADVKKILWERKAPAVYYISPEDDEDWRILCCAPTDAEYSYFASARLIPEKFRGLRADALNAATGLQGGIFCHQAGFIAGFKTREAAEAFANLCLQD